MIFFRGHDESMESANRGNFVKLVKYTAVNENVDDGDSMKA